MKIQHNLWAMNANRNININTGKSAKTTEKLSSGYRINRAADDAAGLSISEKMRRLIRGLTQASRNCQDGISMVQTAEGALHEVHDMLQRMNELAVQSANGTNAQEDRDALQQEFAQIQDEIDRVSQTTTFNAMRLFADEDGSTSTTNAGGTNGTNNTNGIGGANGTNNSNTTSVTGLDETQQQAPVMRMMSLRSVAPVAETSITVGDFTLTGTDLVEGTDYAYSNNALTILSSKAITISGTTTKDQINIGSANQTGVNANITFGDIDIDLSSTNWAAVNVNNDCTLNLTLKGENTLKSGNLCAGLQVYSSGTLVVTEDSDGSLTACGGNNGSGIGGGRSSAAGNITINSGVVKAVGGDYGAGIGGGCMGDGGNVTINGGEITATGGTAGAGIGGGGEDFWDDGGDGGNITINGGKITATGGTNGAGIGGGGEDFWNDGGDGGNITITGGNIVATGNGTAAGIGSGKTATKTGGTIVISGGTVEANGANGCAGIGGCGGPSGSFSTGSDGSAIITTNNGIGDTSEKASWKGTIDNIYYDNGNMTILEDLEITNGNTWTVAENTTLTIPEGVTVTVAEGGTLTNNGTIQNNGTILNKGTLNNNGTITGDGRVLEKGTGTINLSTLTEPLEFTDMGYKIGDKEYYYTGTYTLSGTTTQDITVSADATITLSGDAEVNGIIVDSGKTLTIEGDGKTITVNGGIINNGTINNYSIIHSKGIIVGQENINHLSNGKIILESTGNIDLSKLTDTLTITDTGYTIGTQEYSHTGDYSFTGATDKEININTSTNITLNGVASTSNLNISNDSTVTATLVGNNTIDGVNIASGSKLNLEGNGTLNTVLTSRGLTTIGSDATVIGSVYTPRNGDVDNYGHLIIDSGYFNVGETRYTDSVFNNYGLIDINGSATGTIFGTLVNEGTINLNDTSKITTTGTSSRLENNGTINVGEDALLYIAFGSSSNPHTNNGTINNDGTTQINAKSFTNNGTINNNGNLDNMSSFINNGTVENNEDGTFKTGSRFENEDGGVINNAGTMNSTGTMNNHDGGTVNNTGEWNNTTGTVTNENGGTINNSGELNNTNRGTITNEGTIENTGAFDNSGSVTNNGEINNSGTVSGNDISGTPPTTTVSSGNIDLSTLTDTLTITDTGYTIGNAEYIYNGPYTFTGTTTEEIVVENDADITLNNVTGTKLTVKDNSTANVKLNGTSTMDEVTVESGSTLNTTGSGILKVATKLTNSGTINNGSGSTIENDGTIENGGIFNNNGTLDNDGTINNAGTINNNTGGTIENDGTLENNGTLKNEGTVNNNTGSTIDNTNGTINNSNGTINDNGTITGNQPTTGGGSGGTGGGTGGGSGTGGATVGEAKNSWLIQAGSEAGQGINIQIGAMNTKVLGIEKDTVNILTQESSGNAITAVSGAIEKLSEQRSRLGAYQNRLEHTIYNLDNIVENTTAAESQIRDADMAELMVEHSSNNIIMQAAQAMLAQANHQPDGVLQLLQ